MQFQRHKTCRNRKLLAIIISIFIKLQAQPFTLRNGWPSVVRRPNVTPPQRLDCLLLKYQTLPQSNNRIKSQRDVF